MPHVQPAEPMSIFLQGETSGTAKFDYMTAGGTPQISESPSWLKPPTFVGYTPDNADELLDELNYSVNDPDNAIIKNGNFQIPEGSGVPVAPVYNNTYENPSGQVIPPRAIPASSFPSTGFEAPNPERATATSDIILSSNHMSNGLQAPNQEPTGATGEVKTASGHLSDILHALDQESTADFWMGMYSLGNEGNRD